MHYSTASLSVAVMKLSNIVICLIVIYLATCIETSPSTAAGTPMNELSDLTENLVKCLSI